MMWDALLPAFVMAILTFSVVYVVRIISDNKLRRAVLDSGNLGENAKYLFSGIKTDDSLSAIKWGLVLVALGLALFLGRLFFNYDEGEITLGLMFLFSGIAFLIYYRVANSHFKRIKEKQKSE